MAIDLGESFGEGSYMAKLRRCQYEAGVLRTLIEPAKGVLYGRGLGSVILRKKLGSFAMSTDSVVKGLLVVCCSSKKLPGVLSVRGWRLYFLCCAQWNHFDNSPL